MRKLIAPTALLIMLSTFLSAQTKVHISVATDVNCVVTDSAGRTTGVDSRFSSTREQWRWTRQIPNSVIAYNASNEDGPSNLEFEALLNIPEQEGRYMIQLIGDTTWATFVIVDITANSGDGMVQEPRFDLEGIPVDKDSVVTFMFTYHRAPGAAVSLVKVVSVRTLMQDVAAMRKLSWIANQATADKYVNFIGSYGMQIQSNNFNGARTTLANILQNIASDSLSNLTVDACNTLRPDVQYLLSQLPAPQPGLLVKLINSIGTNLTGGSLQYYDVSWKDAVNNNDGTFSVNTILSTVSLRMTYEGGSQTKSNVSVGPNVVVFQTVNTQVKLQNSQGALIDTGTVQYYYSSWRAFGQTMNGVAIKELLPAIYTFRMTYATANNDKQQDIGANPVVVFTTVNAAVELKNSQGALIDTGTVQYYFSSWQSFGHTVNGVASKELLPANYTFRMSYASATKDKQQNISTNPTVVFNTVNASVQLKNSLGAFIDQGTVQYYFSSWKPFGPTINGVARAELLPASYTFRMAYATVTNDKVQDISTNSTVNFSTVLCTVTVKNGQGQPVDGAQVSYYFSSWVPIGATVGGQVTKELLPASLTFRETIGSATQNKVQNIGTSPLVEFVTQ